MHHKNPTQVFFIIHPGTLGDVALAIPAIQLIRRQFLNHELVLLVRESIGKLFLKLGFVDRVLNMEGPVLAQLLNDEPCFSADVGEILDRCRHAVAWITDRDGKLAMNLERLGIEQRWIMSPHDDLLRSCHQSDRYLETLECWTHDVPQREMFLSSQFGLRSNKSLLVHENSSKSGKSKKIFIHPSGGSSHKCWPSLKMATLIQQLVQENRVKVILCQGPADNEIVSELQSWLLSVNYEIIKDADLVEISQLLKRVDLYIGFDSGVTHLAAALGVPTIAIFGPTDAERWSPKGPHVDVILAQSCQCPNWDSVRHCEKKICMSHSIDDTVQTIERRLNFQEKVLCR